jgi:hypothetical protein
VSRIDELVTELERLWVEPGAEDFSRYRELVVARQAIIDEIRSLDLADLDPETRSDFQQRIDRVRKRDATLIEYLRGQTSDARRRLEDTSSARNAARAYLAPGAADRHRGKIV